MPSLFNVLVCILALLIGILIGEKYRKWKKERGEQLGVDASLLKRYTGQAAFQVIDDAMQIMGGIGYTNDTRIARLWRDQRGARIYAGTEEIMVHSSARQLIKDAVAKAAK